MSGGVVHRIVPCYPMPRMWKAAPSDIHEMMSLMLTVFCKAVQPSIN